MSYEEIKERTVLERMKLRDDTVTIFKCVKGFHREEENNLPSTSNDLNCSKADF